MFGCALMLFVWVIGVRLFVGGYCTWCGCLCSWFGLVVVCCCALTDLGVVLLGCL